MEACDSNYSNDSKKLLAKLVYLLKRSLDEWIEAQLCCSSHCDFNKSQLPFFMSIGTNGISNNKLAADLNVSKQAASKVIKELEEINLVRSEKCGTDGRSVILFLTNEGEKLYHHIKGQIEVLEKDYKKVVGAKNYEIAIEVMQKLNHYHDQLNKVALN
jgi:DNA-binding MarR family transcriptional regulator